MEILDEAGRLALARAEDMTSQGGFEAVVREAATLRAHKVIEHGEDRYTKGEELVNLIETMTMVRKKAQRVNRVLTRCIENGAGELGNEGLDSLRDTLLDQSNYSLMGVQLLDQMMGRAKTVEWSKPEKSKDFPWPFPIEQVAIQVEDIDHTIRFLSLFGLTEWSHDVVTAEGYVGDPRNGKGLNTARLAFNYQAGPFELELITYTQGHNWLETVHGQNSGLSHLGIHVDDMYRAVHMLKEMYPGLAISQEVITQTHSNPKVPAERHYWYVILGTRGMMGFDLKLIQRLWRHTIPPVMITDRNIRANVFDERALEV